MYKKYGKRTLTLQTELKGNKQVEVGLDSIGQRSDRLDGSEVTLETSLAGSQDVLSEFEKIEGVSQKIDGDTVTITADVKGGAEGKAQLEELSSAASKLDGDDIVMSANVRGAASAIGELQALDREASAVDGRDVDITVDKDGLATDRIASLSEGFKGLASNIRATGTVLTASAIPFAIAGLGGGIPTVAALGASFAGLALNLGKASAGFYLVGGAAYAGAKGGLLLYSRLLSSVVSSSREAYTATHAQATAQLEQQRQTILNTKASESFNEEINNQIIGFSRLQAAVGSRVFPEFTTEMQAWGRLLASNQNKLVNTSGAVADVGVGFTKWFRTANEGQTFNRTLGFINSSAIKAAKFLSAAGKAGVSAFQPLIPMASHLQDRIVDVAQATSKWAQSAEGQKRLTSIYHDLWEQAKRLVPVIQDLGRGIINVFTSIDKAGLADQATRGLEQIASGFERVTREGTDSRQKLDAFTNDTRRLMPFAGDAVMAFVRQLGRISGELIDARQQGHKLTILQDIFRGIQRAAKPLGDLLVATFKSLGPEIADLIPNLAKLARNFAGSSGPLTTFVHFLNRALTLFNNLPKPVQTAAANLVALKLILGTLGVGAVVAPLGRFASNMFLANRATAKITGKSALPAVAGSLSKIGLVLAGGIGIAALAGAFIYAYNNSKKFHDQVNKLANDLAEWGKKTFNNAKSAIRDIFDLDTQERKSVKDGASSRAHLFAAHFNAEMQNAGNMQKGEGSAPFEFGFKSGQGIENGLNKWAHSSGGKKRDPIAIFVRGSTSNPVNFGRDWGKGFRQGLQGVDWQSVGEKITRNLQKGITSPKAKNTIVGWFRDIWRNIHGDGDTWTRKTARDITKNLEKGAKDGKQSQSRFKTDLSNIWGAIRGDSDTKWGHIFERITDNTNKAKTHGTKDSWDLKTQAGKAWQGALSAATPTWLKIAGAILDRTNKAKKDGTKDSWDLKSAAQKAWNALQDAAPGPWSGIQKIVTSHTSDMVSSVKGFWNDLIGFINKILSAVHLPTIGTDGGGSDSGAKMTKNTSSGQPGLQARGGLVGMARGGMQGPDGGIATGPRIVYGEAGPEAYVTLGRYTQESAKALNVANQTWAKHGWMERAERGHPHRPDYGHRRGPIATERTIVKRMAGGGQWYPKTEEMRQDVVKHYPGTPTSTYPGHGADGDARNSIDFLIASAFGVKATGKALAKGNSMLNYIMDNWGNFTDYIIWNRYMYDSGGKSLYHGGGGYPPPSSISEWHEDHLHEETLENNPGPSVKGGLGASGGSLWDSVGNALWNKFVQPKLDAYKKSLEGKFSLTQAGGQVALNAIDAIKNMIIDKSGSSGTGDMSNFTGSGMELMRKSLEKYNLPEDWATSSDLWNIAQAESGTTPSDVHFQPNGPRFMAPWGIIVPNRYGISPGSPSFERFALGPRYVKDQYQTPEKAWAHHQTVGSYGRGGITGMGGLPRRTIQAFHLVADTLKRFVGGRGMANGNQGGVGTGKHLVGITNEAGPEAIIPLRRKTPQGMQALRAANKAHGGKDGKKSDYPWITEAMDQGGISPGEVTSGQWHWLKKHGWRFSKDKKHPHRLVPPKKPGRKPSDSKKDDYPWITEAMDQGGISPGEVTSGQWHWLKKHGWKFSKDKKHPHRLVPPKPGWKPPDKYPWHFAPGHHDPGDTTFIAHGRPMGVLGGHGGPHRPSNRMLVGDSRLAGARHQPRDLTLLGNQGGGPTEGGTMERIELHLKNLDEKGVNFRHIEEVLEAALRVQDSPRGMQRHDARNKTLIKRERARL